MDGAHRECSFSNVNIRQREYRIVKGRVNQLRDTISHFHFFQFWSFFSWFEELRPSKNLEEGIRSSNYVSLRALYFPFKVSVYIKLDITQ